LIHSTQQLSNIYKDLKITGIIDTYENGLNFIEHYDDKPNLVSFLGSSFGNFNPTEGIDFLKTISGMMKESDLFLIGFDLKKDESVLHNAYNDSKGITAKFNLNVLNRINTELNADFDLSKFAHHVVYNELQGRIEMHLKSLCTQTVKIPDVNMSINLLKNELIHTENSYKFSISQIESKLEKASIGINKIWYDSRNYFALVLGQKI
jgi:dimethylhistidine N-methyltransferase